MVKKPTTIVLNSTTVQKEKTVAVKQKAAMKNTHKKPPSLKKPLINNTIPSTVTPEKLIAATVEQSSTTAKEKEVMINPSDKTPALKKPAPNVREMVASNRKYMMWSTLIVLCVSEE